MYSLCAVLRWQQGGCVHGRAHTRACSHTCVYIRTCAHTSHVHTHSHLHTFVHACIHQHTHIHPYIHPQAVKGQAHTVRWPRCAGTEVMAHVLPPPQAQALLQAYLGARARMQEVEEWLEEAVEGQLLFLHQQGWFLRSLAGVRCIYMYVCMYVCIHTHTHTQYI